MTPELELAPALPAIQRRHIVYLLALAIAAFILIPRFVGVNRSLTALQSAQAGFIILALACELLRYFLSATSTSILARLFGRKVSFFPLLQAFFAGAAVNRIVSVGGAGGMVVRGAFLVRQGMTVGSVAVLFLIEDLAGLVVGGIVLAIGFAAYLGADRSRTLEIETGLIFVVVGLAILVGAIMLYRRRELLGGIVHGVVRACAWLVQPFLSRSMYDRAKVDRGIEDFYSGVSTARRQPAFTGVVFLLNVARYVAGAAALYFSFQGLNYPISLSMLILMYTGASMASTISAVPGEAAIMGTGFAAHAFSLGVAKGIGMIALLVSRTLAFWLPIPLGLLAFWNLKRTHKL